MLSQYLNLTYVVVVAVVLSLHPNLTYAAVVVVVLVDDADEMVTYGDNYCPNH